MLGMDLATLETLVSSIAAVASLAGAAFAYWREHLSKEAKKGAELARDEAQKASQRSAEQLDAIKRIAESLQGPPFIVEKGINCEFILHEKAGRTWNIREWVNMNSFWLTPTLEAPFTIEPYGSKSIQLIDGYLGNLPPEFVFRLEDETTLHVPIPRP